MKKLLILLITIIGTLSLVAQTTAVNESFETWPAPDWNTYELSLGGSWTHSTIFGSDRGYNGGNAAEHWISNDNCNNWLVTPQIVVSNADYQLIYQQFSTDIQYYSYAGVYISTGSGIPADGDFVALQEATVADDVWTEETIDLSSYVGQNIYLAFVYVGTWHHWRVDEVVVSPPTIMDGGLVEVINPIGVSENTGTEDVIVNLHNFGTETINDFSVEWFVNDVQQTTFQQTSLNLNQGEEAYLTLGQYNFDSEGLYVISANLLLANDFNPGNDNVEGNYEVSSFKDAKLAKVLPEGYQPLAGNKNVVLTIENNGANPFDDVSVNWSVDGVAQTEFIASNLNLQPGESADIVVGSYGFVQGLNEINADIWVLGDINTGNNTYTSFVAVGILWESFESGFAIPEMWTAEDYPLVDTFYAPPHGRYYYISQTDNNYFGVVSDTLWTPLLNIEAGDQISFWINNSAFFTNNDELVYKNGTTGEISLIAEIDSELESWDYLTMDISAASGINYIGFASTYSTSFGVSNLDLISSDAGIYLYDYDLGIKNLSFFNVAKKSETHQFNVELRNYGLNAIQGSEYLIKIITEDGNVLAQQNGLNLDSWQDTTIIIEHTFTEVENIKLYAYIEYSLDQATGNNTSKTLPLSVLPQDIIFNDIGTMDYISPNIPFNTTGNTNSMGTDDLSQQLYYEDELPEQGGYLYGITLYYHEIMAIGQLLPLQVWVKETEIENLSGGWIPTEEMNLVFNDTIEVSNELNSVFIPFDEPMLITGNNNVAIQYFQYDPEWPFTACRFYTTNGDDELVRGIGTFDYYGIDPNNQPDNFAHFTDYTYTTFVFQPIDGDGIISGYIYDENDQPIENASITVGGTGIEEFSDASGYYYLPSLPYETYEISCSYLGYENQSQTVDLNQPNVSADFYMVPLPKVIVSGTVFGSNAPTVPLQDVLVEINGYDNLTTFTNANGEFVFEDVYGNNEYTISFTLLGYDYLIQDLIVDSLDIDMGEIMLSETFNSAYNVWATPNGDEASVEWLSPLSEDYVKFQNDLNSPSYSYTNEPDEDVYLGNLFFNNDLITLTSIEVYWDIYENAHDFVTVEILNSKGDVLVSSLPFLTYNDSLMTIDIPNISVNTDFYAMVHWQHNDYSTDALTIDYSTEIENTAYIKYPGEPAILLSEYIGSFPGAFEIRVNTMVESAKTNNRELLHYNVYKGLSNDIPNAGEWLSINTEPITDLNFIDYNWTNNDPLLYTYAVEAVYVEGGAEMSFSNFVSGYTHIDNSISDNVNVFPNPSSGTVNISGVQGTYIVVYNILGEIVFTENVESVSTKIDVSSFSKGIYFIKIEGLNKDIIKKLVVSY